MHAPAETETTAETGSEVMLPAVPSGLAEAWAEVQASQLGPRMKRALQRVAAGESFRQAAEAEDYADHRNLFRYAVKFKLVDLRTKTLIEQNRKIAHLSGDEMEKRLCNRPEKFSDRDLTVMQGVAVDKVMTHERADSDDGAGYISALEALGNQVRESGRGIEVTVAVRPLDPVDDTIDVTPPRPQQRPISQ